VASRADLDMRPGLHEHDGSACAGKALRTSSGPLHGRSILPERLDMADPAMRLPPALGSVSASLGIRVPTRKRSGPHQPLLPDHRRSPAACRSLAELDEPRRRRHPDTADVARHALQTAGATSDTCRGWDARRPRRRCTPVASRLPREAVAPDQDHRSISRRRLPASSADIATPRTSAPPLT
jgi:hypothetical protein